MSRLRSFQALALSLVLLFTAHSMAAARGQADSAGQMVLCIGTSSVVVFVDQDGQPTGPPHVCPDCALSLFEAPGLGPDLLVFTFESRRIDWPGSTAAVWLHHARSPMARGPPTF